MDINGILPLLYILLGALVSLLGGLIQKRFDLELDKENNDKLLLSKIFVLTFNFFKAKLKQQLGSSNENVLKLSRQMGKYAFQMRSKKFKDLKIKLINFDSEAINNFKLENLENLQIEIESILLKN